MTPTIASWAVEPENGTVILRNRNRESEESSEGSQAAVNSDNSRGADGMTTNNDHTLLPKSLIKHSVQADQAASIREEIAQTNSQSFNVSQSNSSPAETSIQSESTVTMNQSAMSQSLSPKPGDNPRVEDVDVQADLSSSPTLLDHPDNRDVHPEAGEQQGKV